MHRFALATLALLAATATTSCFGASRADPGVALPPCTWAPVTDIVDGDTIRVRHEGRNEPVRYIGIDAPELSAAGGPEPLAGEATAANRRLVGGRDVCLERDVSDRDRFGRLLRYAWLADGTLVNQALLEQGLATVVVFAPDTKYHADRLYGAEDTARRARIGIWAPATR